MEKRVSNQEVNLHTSSACDLEIRDLVIRTMLVGQLKGINHGQLGYCIRCAIRLDYTGQPDR